MRKAESEGFTLKDSEGIVFDFGKLKYLKWISKPVMTGINNLQLKIRRFPKNSMFVALLFEKTG